MVAGLPRCAWNVNKAPGVVPAAAAVTAVVVAAAATLAVSDSTTVRIVGLAGVDGLRAAAGRTASSVRNRAVAIRAAVIKVAVIRVAAVKVAAVVGVMVSVTSPAAVAAVVVVVVAGVTAMPLRFRLAKRSRPRPPRVSRMAIVR